MSDFITRKEQYLAYIAGESDTYPDEPITREETFLAEIALRIASGGTGGSGGVGILKIQKTSTNGLVDTYTITYTDNTKSTFTVTNGKDGKTPYIQDGYWYIDGVNTNVKAEGKDGANGTNGKDGVDGKDYVLTEADKTEIAGKVVDMLGGSPVYAVIDENNIVTVKGLPDNESYTFKLEMEDGSTVDVGEFEPVIEPTYTNLATQFAVGRLNSSGNIDASATAATTVEDFIEFKPDDVVRIKGLTLGGYNVGVYTSAKAITSSAKPTFPQTNTYWECEQESNGVYKFTSKFSTNGYIRFSGVTDNTSNIVITLNELIE